MTMPARLLRLLAGFGLLAALLATSFAAVIPAIQRWGATNQEIGLALPGGLWAAYRSARPAPLAMPKLPAPSAT